jgi:hypothetical protein
MRTLAMLVLLASTSFAADPLVSGVPVGKRPGPYSFLVATGAQRGQQTCYICEQADKPTAVVFARTLTEPLGKLLVELDAEAVARKDKGFKVWMTQLAATADLNHLAKWGQKQGLKNVPVGAFEDIDGPPAYKLHKDADVTVLLFVKEKVVVNAAFRVGELDETQSRTIRKSVGKLFE